MGKGFKHGASGGGGAPLDFQVVGGTSAPASPKENTIWVKTSTPITPWYIGPNEPSVAEGVVWVQTDVASRFAFNALKKNSLMVYPAACKVWNGAKFTLADASIYQGGKWSQFSVAWDGTLFNNGDRYEMITGGWANASGDTLAASFYSNQNFSPPVRTEKMIDLTDFDTLHVTYTGVTGKAHFGVTKTRDLTLSSQYATFMPASVGTVELNVSGLTGEYYVTLVAGAETGGKLCAFTATNAWLT